MSAVKTAVANGHSDLEKSSKNGIQPKQSFFDFDMAESLMKDITKDRGNHVIGEVEFGNVLNLVMGNGNSYEEIEKLFCRIKQAKNKDFEQKMEKEVKSDSNDTLYRGYMIIDKEFKEEVQEIAQLSSTESRPIWFLYSGNASQWRGMTRQLMLIPEFKTLFEECANILLPVGVDLLKLLEDPKADIFENLSNGNVMITATQICMTDILNKLGIIPDGIIGLSHGEIGAGYGDQALTKEQALKLAYLKGRVLMENLEKVKGSLAMVNLSGEELQPYMLPKVTLTSSVSSTTSGISGDTENIRIMLKFLRAKGVRVHETDSLGVAYHSDLFLSIADEMLDYYKQAITEPKLRSKKWVSCCILDEDRETNPWCSAEYYVTNTCGKCYLLEAMQKIPENAIIIEISPHAYLQNIVKAELPNNDVVGLARKEKPELLEFLKAIGKLYNLGCNIKTDMFTHNGF